MLAVDLSEQVILWLSTNGTQRSAVYSAGWRAGAVQAFIIRSSDALVRS